MDDCGIGDYLAGEVDKLVKAGGHGQSRRGKRRSVRTVESFGGVDGFSPVDDAAEVISDAAAQFEHAVSLLDNGHKRKRRR